ncbi:MAG: sigma-54-dependent Fis family transcriptional regulator [Alphaproteobacteria bacterium]|nr:sigma-54-dependent Fis family transcriptional regulator [Alphaproteobacteria bacterium]
MGVDILIVDDEADIRNLVKGILEDEGYSIKTCATSAEAYEIIKKDKPGLIIQDIWLQGSADDGLKILHNARTENPYLPFIMISGHGTIETAVAAIKEGAYDFIEKPFKSDRLILMVRRALENAALKKENAALKRQAKPAETLIGNSPVIQKLKTLIERAAPTKSRVLLTGEQGTGKDIVARFIHSNSERAEEPFLVVNCATLNPQHLEAELFGEGVDENGTSRIGLLEQAHGGTLLLDEVSDMPLETQTKIVRVLQEERFQRSGSQGFVPLDVRILATTNRNLLQAIKDGGFREDLYYRLNVVPIHIPPLKERSEDIEALCTHFLNVLSAAFRTEIRPLNAAALQMLKNYNWPGNVRQLRNVIEWMLIMHGQENIKEYGPSELPPEINKRINTANTDEKSTAASQIASITKTDFLDLSLRDARAAFETEYLRAQIERFDGNVSKTAQFIGMERSALHRKLKSLSVGEDENQEAEENQKADQIRKRA